MNSYKVQVLESFLSPAECSAIVNEIESVGFENQFSGDGRLIRSRAQFENVPMSELLWRRLKPRLPKLTEVYDEIFIAEPSPKRALENYVPVCLNERFRCYKYGADEEFRRHQDFAHEYSENKRTFLTVLLYLNTGYDGGIPCCSNRCVMVGLFRRQVPANLSARKSSTVSFTRKGYFFKAATSAGKSNSLAASLGLSSSEEIFNSSAKPGPSSITPE